MEHHLSRLARPSNGFPFELVAVADLHWLMLCKFRICGHGSPPRDSAIHDTPQRSTRQSVWLRAGGYDESLRRALSRERALRKRALEGEQRAAKPCAAAALDLAFLPPCNPGLRSAPLLSEARCLAPTRRSRRRRSLRPQRSRRLRPAPVRFRRIANPGRNPRRRAPGWKRIRARSCFR